MQNEAVAASVILYNSDVACLNQIASYQNQVGKLYVIDNSDKPNLSLVQRLTEFTNVEYVSNKGNKGVAYALNKGAELASRDGFQYLLTMDDDSRMPDTAVLYMLTFLQKFNEKAIGILSVAHSEPTPNTVFKYVDYTMTSGNLLSLRAYKETGPFDDQLFIDYVDHEYSLRLKLKGFVTIELAHLKLDHQLGVQKRRRFAGFNISFVSHSPKRLYYLFRNGIYIVRKHAFDHPIPCLKLLGLTLKEAIKSLFVEDDKLIRGRYLTRAVSDGFNNRMGKLIDR